MQLFSCEPLLILVVAKEDFTYINSPIPVHKVSIYMDISDYFEVLICHL